MYAHYAPLMDDRVKVLSDNRERNHIVEKLEKGTCETYSEHVLRLKPHVIDLTTTTDNLKKLFGPKRVLICRRYEFQTVQMSATERLVRPYRKYGNMIKRKFENASMKDVDSNSLNSSLSRA